MSVGSLVSAGPLLLAIPVAAAAGAVTFLSPCVLPLVPGYLSYITGMSGAGVATTQAVDAAEPPTGPAEGAGSGGTAVKTAPKTAAASGRPPRSRVLAGAGLFVLGFSVLFALEGVAIGGIGTALQSHAVGLSRLLGVLLILLGLLFAGVFDRFGFSGRIVKPQMRPRAGLASAPLIGVLFGLGWTPCIGPTLSAVLLLGASSGTAARGGLLAFVYGLGIGIPMLVVAFAFDRGVTMFGFARRHARAITKIGGILLIAVGVLEVTGAWASAMSWLQSNWLADYNSPI
ncbi:MAG TPA: cytochrome c biogenesis protein CcdA [Streptosporangiaceae bacterium]|nr:cytochrome c biogenesis protein CcdA [Streptosporangiaceae bacterium]